MHEKQPAIYIMASQPKSTLYIGVTSDLIKRVYDHREGLAEGFTKRYRCKTLVYFEQHGEMVSAIEREKQLKNKSRKAKIQLIERFNPTWKDLYAELI